MPRKHDRPLKALLRRTIQPSVDSVIPLIYDDRGNAMAIVPACTSRFFIGVAIKISRTAQYLSLDVATN
jgi:hypothetical protein